MAMRKTPYKSTKRTKTAKTGATKKVKNNKGLTVFIFVGIFGIIGAALLFASQAASTTKTITLTPTHDTFASQFVSQEPRNEITFLRVNNALAACTATTQDECRTSNSRVAYLKFYIKGIPDQYVTIDSVKLKLYTSNSSADGGNIYRANSTNWDETSLTWENQPGYDPAKVLGSLGSVTAGNWREITLRKGAVNGGERGPVAFAIANNDADMAAFSSRETGNMPQLIITYTESPPSTLASVNTYYGTTHAHTGCCNNHGSDKSTAKDIYAAAKQKGFDWLILTEHSGSSGPSSQGLNPATFYNDVKAQAAAATDATFVGIPGYEYSDNDGGGGIGKGHMTGVNTDEFLSADGTANAVTLTDYLVAQRKAGKNAYGGYNHPYTNGGAGSVSSVLTPERREVIVMSEVHNSYSLSADGPHFSGLIAALDRGWRIAPTCGLDGHGTYRLVDTQEPGPCRTGVLASTLTKASIDEAFIARRLFASRDINMDVKYAVNNKLMGSIIGKPTTLDFEILVSDPDTALASDKIKKIEIVTSGGVVAASKTFDSHSVEWKTSIPANNKKYYLLKIYNGERSTYTAAAAPVWLE